VLATDTSLRYPFADFASARGGIFTAGYALAALAFAFTIISRATYSSAALRIR
jgi:hypothetical protein